MMILALSRHAKEQARERGISIELIKTAIQGGAKFLQGTKIVADFTYVRIIYRKNREEYSVITVMVKKDE
ncbi:DUF4258 domain-containing protein [Candidatus Woesearchaeota archaeon]|nr:DUF4258 domain-containing protein [Candidatus Woesearchaeota archaeon]